MTKARETADYGHLGKNKNLLINGNFQISQRAFGGGQPATGVYGYDRWKGDATGTQIEQVIEQANMHGDGDYTISWQGGTGTSNTQPARISGFTADVEL